MRTYRLTQHTTISTEQLVKRDREVLGRELAQRHQNREVMMTWQAMEEDKQEDITVTMMNTGNAGEHKLVCAF